MTERNSQIAEEIGDVKQQHWDGDSTTTIEKQFLAEGCVDDHKDLVAQSNAAYIPNVERQLLDEGHVYDDENLVVAKLNAAYSEAGQTITQFFLLSALDVPAFLRITI